MVFTSVVIAMRVADTDETEDEELELEEPDVKEEPEGEIEEVVADVFGLLLIVGFRIFSLSSFDFANASFIEILFPLKNATTNASR